LDKRIVLRNKRWWTPLFISKCHQLVILFGWMIAKI